MDFDFDGGESAGAGAVRRVRIVHERCAFVTLPPDVVAATLRMRSTRTATFPRHVALRRTTNAADDRDRDRDRDDDDDDDDRRGASHRIVHVAWAGGVTPGGEHVREIGIPHALASVLDLVDGEEVAFAFGQDAPVAESVTVSPCSADDWEAALAQAEAMEATALAQIGLAVVGQAVPFYAPGGGKPLFLRVGSIAPSSCGDVARLATATELVIEPWRASERASDVAESMKGTINLNEWYEQHDPNMIDAALRLQLPLGADGAKSMTLATRAVAYDFGTRAKHEQKFEIPLTSVLAVDRSTADAYNMRRGALVRVFKFDAEREYDFTRDADAADADAVYLRVLVVDEANAIAPNHACLETHTALAMEWYQGDTLHVKEVDEASVRRVANLTVRLKPLLPALPFDSMDDPVAADVFSQKKSIAALSLLLGPAYATALGFNASDIDGDEKVSTSYVDKVARAILTAWLKQQRAIPWGSDSSSFDEYVVVNSKTRAVLRLPADGESRVSAAFELDLLFPSSARMDRERPTVPVRLHLADFEIEDARTRVEMGSPRRVLGETPTRNPAPGVTVWPFIQREEDAFAHAPGSHLREHMDEALQRLKMSLWFEAMKLRDEYGVGMFPGILVTGPKSRGRSRLVKSLCKLLSDDVKAVSSIVEIDCAKLPKPHVKTLDAIRAGFEAAKARKPSICYLLNFDEACSSKDESEDAEHLAHLVAEDMAELADEDAVTFMATASEWDALAKPLREEEIFGLKFEVKKPNMEARRDVFLSYARYRNVDLEASVADAMAEKTDGYNVVDIRYVVDSALRMAIDREPHSTKRLAILSIDLLNAMKDYTPVDQANLRKSDGQPGQGVDNYVDGFDTIGGYDDIKSMLDDAIALPARHPKIFKQCPLRLPSGVLLYGAPGCGKTAMAKAAIANAGLKSITIRGPELFNKYYGETEASLRRLFRSAADAAPCALLFDEFESLAPRRGGSGDSAVTDRIVNQLLTLLDGVEALEGVFVICTTTHPENIDPALLRPGRLDYLLYMPLPDAQCRLAILETLMRGDVKVSPKAKTLIMERLGPYDFEGFTGADLKSFVEEYTSACARRTVAEFNARAKDENAAETLDELPPIEERDVMEALKRVRASMNQETRNYYHRIHAAFGDAHSDRKTDRKTDKTKDTRDGDEQVQTYAGM